MHIFFIILIFLAILLVLVVSHEFGHFIIAKKSGIRVDEFSFGFPPKIFGKKIGETTYNFNAIPFGGYVKIFGENPDEESISGPDSARSFVNKPKYIQAAVLLGGVTMNFLIAWLLLSIGFMSGMPTAVSNMPANAVVRDQALTITAITPNSPAKIAGLQPGDKIVLLTSGADVTETPTLESVSYFVKRHSTEPITVSYIRSGKFQEIDITPEQNIINGGPGIGISAEVIGKVSLPVHQAVWKGLQFSLDLFKHMVKGFYELIVGKTDIASVSGVVGIVGAVGDATELGFIYLLYFTAFISINLAVINLVPFPALDGGRLLFLLIEVVKGSRIKPQVANIFNFVGFMILILLMLFVTYKDIVKII